uniref:Arylsulfatase F n=1 Tax=Loxodonta africana TaxID=9785 RepID=G3TUY4_LOXAF
SIFLSLVCLFLNTQQSHAATEDKPNIFLIMVDDLGIGDLGCYGNDTISRMTNSVSISQNPVPLSQCIYIASILYPPSSIIYFISSCDPVLSEEVLSSYPCYKLTVVVPSLIRSEQKTFLPTKEKQIMCVCLISGKWHQGLNCHFRSDYCHHPYHYGFDYYYGMPYSLYEPCWPDPSRDTELAIGSKLWQCVQLVALAVLTLAIGKLRGWISVPWPFILAMNLFLLLLAYSWFSSFTSGLYWDCILMRGQEITEQPLKAERAGSIMVQETISFIERNRRGPFLLYFSFLHVHIPLPTTEDFIGTSQHGLYGDNVQEMDAMVGKILAVIDDFGLRNNTLVHFTSDHGGHLEGRIGHTQLGGWNGIFKGGKGMGGWEGGIRVPGIFRWPAKLPAGQSIEEPTSSMDIFPTLASLSGGILPRDRVIDGRDLMPLLSGEIQRSEHQFLFHYCGSYLHAVRWHPQDSEAVWKAHYVTPIFQPPGAQACYATKYCQCSGENVTHHNPPLLFDLSRDPSESTPLSRDTEPLYDLVIEKVAAALREHLKSVIPVQEQLSEINRDRVWLRPCCGVFPFCLCDKEGKRLAGEL